MAIKVGTISTLDNQVGKTNIQAILAHLGQDCHNATSLHLIIKILSSLNSKDGVWSFQWSVWKEAWGPHYQGWD